MESTTLNDNQSDSKNMCMLCLNCNTAMDINADKSLKEFCFEKILETDSSKISLEEEHRICVVCFNKLEESLQFFKQCQASYQSLQMHYSINDMKNSAHTNISYMDSKANEDNDLNTIQLRNRTASVIKPKSKLCSFCGKQFASYSKLVQHLTLHTIEATYKCGLCGKILTTKGGLLQHEQTHTGEKPFKCEYCPKAFVQSNQLNAHRKLHTGKDILCSICPKAFCRRSELNLHMRTHTGEVPHSCEECGKKFRLVSHLREHETTHRNVRSHICKHCGDGFKRRSTLTDHELIHTGEFRHKCALCEYGSYKKWSLTQHILRYHS